MNNETLVYDLITNKAYCLNETSAEVFNACGNKETFDHLKSKHNFTDDLIYLSLDELKKNNLLEGEYNSPFIRMNRREVIRKVSFASMIALPVISSLVAPQALNAASGSSCAFRCTDGGSGNNACAGCSSTVTVTTYSSNNGTCTGATGSFTYDCSGGLFSGSDISIAPI